MCMCVSQPTKLVHGNKKKPKDQEVFSFVVASLATFVTSPFTKRYTIGNYFPILIYIWLLVRGAGCLGDIGSQAFCVYAACCFQSKIIAHIFALLIIEFISAWTGLVSTFNELISFRLALPLPLSVCFSLIFPESRCLASERKPNCEQWSCFFFFWWSQLCDCLETQNTIHLQRMYVCNVCWWRWSSQLLNMIATFGFLADIHISFFHCFYPSLRHFSYTVLLLLIFFGVKQQTEWRK